MPLFELTDEQEAAVNTLEGNLQIIACAGSGKTEVVSRRIAELIKQGTGPSSVVAFTFTEKAAEELKARIREILDQECPERADLGEMYVGTIHSFCFEMLKELEPRYRGYDVLDDPRRAAFISMPRRYYRSHLKSLNERGKFRTISKFFRSCDIVRMEDIDLGDLTDEDFVECYTRYEKFLEEYRFLDFTSMIYRLVKMLESNGDAKDALHKKINHLVVDEYQDVNQLQEKLIRLISEGCKSLCVVGDDDQCIYNWRGSTVANMINFPKEYGAVIQKPLSRNFRSTEAVIECANKFIENNQGRIKKEMRPRETPVNAVQNGDLFYKNFETEDEEFKFIVRRISDLMGTDFYDKKGNPFSISYGDIAILTRRRAEAAKLVPYLDEAGIKFVLDIGREVFDRPEVILGLKCIAYCFGIPDERENVTEDGLADLYESVFCDQLEEGHPRYPDADVNLFIDELNKIRAKVDGISAKGRNDYLNQGLQHYYHKILDAFGAARFEFENIYNYNFAVLSQAISDYESVWRRLRASEVKYFFGFISAYGAYSYADTSHNDPSLLNAVKVLTIHRAKGLEFPIVFVPGMVEERKPRRRSTFVDENLYDIDRYIGAEEDERRVYYTAITRSMKYLVLTGSVKRIKRDGTPYVRPFNTHPFVEEIVNDNFVNATPIKRRRSGYSNRKLSGHLFPTSFTDISCFERCGYDYLLRNIYGYQVPLPPAYGYGLRIHNILNVIYKQYISSGKLPSEKKVEDLFDRHFFLRYATDRITESMKKGGVNVVNSYIDLNKDDFSRVLETEKKFELVMGEALISGVIDLIKKFDENGKLEEVEVVDFKTEKEAKDFYRKDYDLQLGLYAIACLRSLGLNPKKACVHHLDVRTGKNKKEYVDISKPKLQAVKQRIERDINNIIGKDTPPSPTRICGDCDWKRICPQKS